MLFALGTAGIFHLYRNGQAQVILKALQDVEHSVAKPLQATADSTPSGASSPQQQSSSSFIQQLTGSWSRQDFADISVEAPFTLTQYTPGNQGLKPNQLRQIVQRNQWIGKSADGFQVEAVFFQIDGTHTYSLEDGAEGPLRLFAMKAGDPNPAFRKSDVFVNGLPARRISYARAFNGTNQHLEELLVQANRKVMGVVVSFPGDSRISDAERVLSSMSVRSR
jgi:hypothetical protein